MGGPAPFYTMQDMAAAQADPVQYDQQAVRPPAPPQQPPPPPPGPPPGAQFPSPAFGGGGNQPLVPGTPLPPVGPAAGSAGLVQPPPNMGPQPAMPTMGQLQNNASPDPDGFQARQQAYINRAMQLVAPLMLPKYTEPPPVSTAAKIMSFGTAGLNAANYAAWSNWRADQHNNAMSLKAMEMAQQMMNADATQEMAKAHLGVAIGNQQLALGRFELEGIRTRIEAMTAQMENQMRQMQAQAFPYEHPGGPPLVPSPSGVGGSNTMTPPVPSGPATQETGPRPGESAYDYAQRRKSEIAQNVKNAGAKAQADEEIQSNAAQLQAQLGPDVDQAIDEALPDTKGDLGVVARLKGAANASTLNPLESGFLNQAAKGGSAANRLQTVVDAVLPFIRSVSGGTKGVRLTQTELQLLTGRNLQALAQGHMGREQGHAVVKAARDVVARATGAATSTPMSAHGPTTTTQPPPDNTQTTPQGFKYRVVQ